MEFRRCILTRIGCRIDTDIVDLDVVDDDDIMKINSASLT